jgi:hypothetical protein
MYIVEVESKGVKHCQKNQKQLYHKDMDEVNILLNIYVGHERIYGVNFQTISIIFYSFI